MLKIHQIAAALLCIAPLSLFASSQVSDPRMEEIGRSADWVRQLYLTKTDGRPAASRMRDADFYLSSGPAIDPVRELEATYRAMLNAPETIDDDHPICRFPSRYLFLEQHLGFPGSIDVLSACPAFSAWADLGDDSHVTLVMVDGYYGNPASSFGHLVVRLGSKQDSRSLLDTSINYGARVPDGDGPFTYILKGLFGGYEASFTLEDFYRQDLVYTRTEFRDMWNYRLALTQAQRLRFVAHIWELLGHPSAYYFVKNNCAFAVAEALEVALEREVVDQDINWYPPIALFQTLESLDARSATELIAKRTYMPSQRRQLSHLLSLLNERQAEAMRSYLLDDAPLDSILASLAADEQAALLEALIQYHDYLIQGYPELGTRLYDRRRELLVARLALPAGRHLVVEDVPTGTPAGLTSRTARLTLGIRHQSMSTGALLGFVPFQRSPTDRGNGDLAELTLLNTSLIVADESLSLDDLTLIRASQRSDLGQRLPDQWPLSWSIDIGATCLADCGGWEGVRAELGLGQTLSLGPLWFSGLGYLGVHGDRGAARLELEVGLPERLGWSARGRLGQVAPLTGGSAPFRQASAEIRFSPNTDHSLFFNGQVRGDQWSQRLGWQWHYR